MKNIILTLVFLINLTISFGQKTKDSSTPVTNKPFVYSNTIKYISPLIDNSIQCVTFLRTTQKDDDTKKEWHSNQDAEINSSILFNNELYIGGDFNRINGVECYNLIKIRNDSIFAIFVGKNKKDWTKNGTYDIGTINKFCIFKEHLFAATENGLWELDNDHWIRIGTGLEVFTDDINDGYVNIKIDEKQIVKCWTQVKDIAVQNEKLYLVFDGSHGYCNFKRKLIEFTGNKFIAIKDSTNILKENTNSLTLTSTNDGLYLSTDSVLAKYNGQSIELIKDKTPPLKLFTWNEQAFGLVCSRDVPFKHLFKIEGDTVIEYWVDGLAELNMSINKFGIGNNELFMTSNWTWKSDDDKSWFTYLYSIKDSKILRTNYKNENGCEIVFYKNKPLSIFFNEKKCNEIEGKGSGLLVSDKTISPNNSSGAQTKSIGQTNLIISSGNAYKTVKIGTHIWMAENFKTTHFANGDLIQKSAENVGWYVNKPIFVELSNGQYLYSWEAIIDSRGIAPSGWHVPSPSEWEELISYCSSSSDIKSITGWTKKGNNKLGFNIKPLGHLSGGYYINGNLQDQIFWSSMLNTDPKECGSVCGNSFLFHAENPFTGSPDIISSKHHNYMLPLRLVKDEIVEADATIKKPINQKNILQEEMNKALSFVTKSTLGTVKSSDCYRCKGTGIVKVCPICSKRGKVHCKECKGSGYDANYRKCLNCSGSGITRCHACNGKIYNIKCQHTVWQFQH
jgi:uncharacterized protein (TIGR02145 family)